MQFALVGGLAEGSQNRLREGKAMCGRISGEAVCRAVRLPGQEKLRLYVRFAG